MAQTREGWRSNANRQSTCRKNPNSAILKITKAQNSTIEQIMKTQNSANLKSTKLHTQTQNMHFTLQMIHSSFASAGDYHDHDLRVMIIIMIYMWWSLLWSARACFFKWSLDRTIACRLRSEFPPNVDLNDLIWSLVIWMIWMIRLDKTKSNQLQIRRRHVIIHNHPLFRSALQKGWPLNTKLNPQKRHQTHDIAQKKIFLDFTHTMQWFEP